MLVNVDVKSLEIVVAAFLSQDPTLMKELQDGIDFHEDNRVRFKLPSRLIAKVLGFRILYGGTEHSFIKDPDFASVSRSKDYWKKAIDNYYSKYRGIAEWHKILIQQATTTGKIVSPTGREYHYQPKESAWGLEWPVTTIKNYIVQGMGADLVMIARISLYNRLKKLGLKSKLVATVHDSIIIDCPEDEWKAIAALSLQCVRDVPMNFERLYKVPFNLSLNAEVLYGPTLGKMEEWK